MKDKDESIALIAYCNKQGKPASVAVEVTKPRSLSKGGLMDMISHALRYGKAGFPIFPCCWPDLAGNCACGRGHAGGNIGKVPLTQTGLKEATTNPEAIKSWWQRWPEANIAIAIPQGYFVLDVDVEHNGYDSLGLLQDYIGELPETLQITTGSGGMHLWYKTTEPIKNTAQLSGFKGLDIRGIGGYVITSPSLHRSGHRYEKNSVWNGPITNAPAELVRLCVERQPIQSNREIPSGGGAYTEGSRNQGLASIAGSLRARGLSAEAILGSLREINLKQCSPPLPEREIETIAKSYNRYPAGQPPKQGDNGFKGVLL